MFKYVEFDLTEKLQENNVLEVMLFTLPKIPGKPDDRHQAAQSLKPAVSYVWDLHPRLIPRGIWDDTYFAIRNEIHFADVYLDYHLSDNFDSVAIILEIEGSDIVNKKFKRSFIDPSGTTVIDESGIISELAPKTFILDNPKLWWKHDHGMPNLYTSKLDCLIMMETN